MTSLKTKAAGHERSVRLTGSVKFVAWSALMILAARATAHGATEAPTAALYGQHCASCHGDGRLGAMGPALLPDNLSRLKPAAAAKVIAEGRPQTQMPGFAAKLKPAEIEALAAFLLTPPAQPPVWGLKEIAASRVVNGDPANRPAAAVHKADLQNMFLVVELGDHHVSVLDGDRLERIHRFPSRFALHGGPKFSPDGRYAYLMSRDGWVSKFDMLRLEVVAEVRAAINSRNIAVAGDGRHVLVGAYVPPSLVVLDAVDLKPVKVIDVKARDGTPSRVSAVYAAPPRGAFVVALKDVPELWEVSWEDHPDSRFYQGLVHDYKKESGEPLVIEPFAVRRIQLETILDDFFFVPGFDVLVGAAREGGKGQVVNLIVGRPVGTVDLPGLPHLGSGISWLKDGKRVLATPNLKEGIVTLIEMDTWRNLARVPIGGPGFFLRSHEQTPYAWGDTSAGPGNDTLYLLDKKTLTVARTLTPEKGRAAAHVEFTRDGRYALVSLQEMDGAVIVYDAETLKEVKRIPMVKPSGKYNVHNKVHLSEGTSR